MQDYDKSDALESILKRIRGRSLEGYTGDMEARLRSAVKMAIDLDIEYIDDSGGYYDDDDAFEYITDGIARLTGADDEEAVLIAQFVDEFMDCQQEYLSEKGLIEWD